LLDAWGGIISSENEDGQTDPDCQQDSPYYIILYAHDNHESCYSYVYIIGTQQYPILTRSSRSTATATATRAREAVVPFWQEQEKNELNLNDDG
jgi:hypothetical protein